jgi:prepilin-type N-terminal cleavage/methylation domain-containing protein
MNNRAFTLVEVMVSVLLSAVVMEAIYTMVLVGQKSWNEYSNALVPKEEVRRGLTWISTELREAQNPVITQDRHNSSINFERPMVGPVSYQWSDQGENANQIIRINNDQKRVLAKGISSVSFTSPTDDQVIVSLTGGKSQGFNLKEQIALRAKTGLFLQGQNEAVK